MTVKRIDISCFAALLVVFLLLDCSRSVASDSTGHIDLRADSTSASSVSTPWPTYLASDYDQPGHPTLTVKQAAMIRFALARVMPCQRAILRYAFPSNPDYLSFVLFFEETYAAPHQGGGSPHVFWTSGTYYNQDSGESFLTKFRVSDNIKYDIDHRGCAPGVPAILLGAWDCVTDSGGRAVYRFEASHKGYSTSDGSTESFTYQYDADQRQLYFGYGHNRGIAQNVTLGAHAMAMVVSGYYHEGNWTAMPSQAQLACLRHTD